MRRTPAQGALRVKACAKINVTLRVLGVRDDGYHELRTTFQSLALHDTLTFTPLRGPFTIEADAPGCPADPTNLVWKAADALWRVAGRRGVLQGVRVRIRKRIPSEAGLGGGSSDAAAALRALSLLWNVRASDGDLAGIARALGADVAYFLEGGTALGVERGDVLIALADAPRAWVVLARPDFGVSTREAYGWWDLDRGAKRGRLVGPLPGRSSELVNDLEGPVTARHPRVGALVRRLGRLGAARAAMSGSGSAVFGLFADERTARKAADALAGRTVTTLVTRTVNRREYRAAGAPRRTVP
jgi:4-diphosphocytidyl-2-C-methyl-D-erythritol kinase